MKLGRVDRGVRRYDRGALRRRPRRDDSTGALLFEMSVTKAPAVFIYTRADGKRVREFRAPEHVFSADNMERMARSPITLNHPPVRVTTANIKEYGVGHADGTIRVEDSHAIVGAVLHDEAAIESLESGATVQTSCGYDCDVIHEPGVYVDDDGRRWEYDAIQVNHRNNHHALVPRGRAETTRALLDSMGRMDAIQTEEESMTKQAADRANYLTDTNPRENLASLHIDGVSVPMELNHASRVAEALAKKDAALSEQTDRADALEAERDDLKTKLDEANGKLEHALFADSVMARVDERIALFDRARPHFDDEEWKEMRRKEDGEIKRAAVAKAKPDLDLTEKSDAYVDAAFDLLEDAKRKDEADSLADSLVNSGSRMDTGEHAEAQGRVDAAFKAADERWRKPVPGGITIEGKTRPTA